MDQGEAPRRFVDADCDEILRGLEFAQKRLPSRLFYDARGSALFDQICELPEYYVTRTERAIMQTHVAEMAQVLGAGVQLVEFGSGSSSKTCLLLDQLDACCYVPVDISGEHLWATARRLALRYPRLPIAPLAADFTRELSLPKPDLDAPLNPRLTAVYFPGSTLGNFEPMSAVALLRRIRRLVGGNGGLLLGADLKKDRTELEAAYDDKAGVTAEFNLNLLARLNRDYGANFVLADFSHRALYDEKQSRVEMHLVAKRDLRFSIFDQRFTMHAGETLHTENSYKYSLDGLGRLARASGFSVCNTWSDPHQRFAVQWWEARNAAGMARAA